MLKEAFRLYQLGAAVHWIRAGSKAPVKSGWSGPTRDDWATVKADYRPGYGLGVRLGESSALVGGGYLANIDVDVKSSNARHLEEAFDFVRKRFPSLKNAPRVKTGYGYRFFCRTDEPVSSGKLGASGEETKVLMPTAPVNKRQLAAVAEGRLTRKELDAGYRIRPAWEVEFMSIGKQVVLPPSIHPDTGKPYKWVVAWEGILPLVKAPSSSGKASSPGRPAGLRVIQNFEPEDAVDLSRLSARIRAMIEDGSAIEDRSAACYSVCIAMHKSGYSDNEILTVLTDRGTLIGETAYEHRSTESRAAAAAWIRDYSLEKAIRETSAAKVFEAEVEVTEPLSDDEAAAQAKEVTGERDWRLKLQRAGKENDGSVKPTLANVLLILTNAVAPDVFMYDQFADREFYSRNVPWTAKAKGRAVADIDAVNIKYWLASKFNVEPSVQVIFEAIGEICSKNAFHPVREELEALPEWDGVPRVDTWLKKYFQAKGPDEYLAQVFRKWLVASITRVYQPGHKFDWMPIFEGKQGTGKSSFGAILFGHKYFSDWLPALSDKDAALGLQGLRCVEFGELDSLRRNEIETVKAFVTRQVDKVRPPYGRKKVEVSRQSVFFGTTNKEHYFRDDTGNRRFNPVLVGYLDFEALERDRDQIWAEALFIYNAGLEPTLYLEGEAGVHALEAQQEKMVATEADVMADELMHHFEVRDSLEEAQRFDFSKFRLIDLFNGFGPLAKWPADARNLQFAGKAINFFNARQRYYEFLKVKVRGLYRFKLVKSTPEGAPL